MSKIATYRRKMNLLGIDYSLGTCNNFRTCISLSLPKSTLRGHESNIYLVKALKLIDDYFFKSLNKTKKLKKVFETEKAATTNECYYNNRCPETIRKRNKIDETAWGRLPTMDYESPATIASITLNDLKNYYTKHFTPDNMSIMFMGNINKDAILKMVQKSSLTQHTSGGQPKILPTKIAIGKPTVFHSRINIKEFGNANAGQGFFETKLCTNDFSEHIMNIAMLALRPRLENEMREKLHWTYSVKGITSNRGVLNELLFFTRLPVEALNLVEDTFDTVLTSVTSNEKWIIEAKKLRLADWRITKRSFEKFCTNVASEISRHGRAISDKEDIDKFSIVTIESVQEFLKYFLDRKNRFTTIGYP